ncbi:hypothetical protein LCGC14_1170790 [marine sediment metagenome]|uniref:Uncharacterized protein n=1 Tax=marine sediment metagenome TaxID=412755 RepID=A0A0F9P832_9ZZZZ
MSLDYWNDLTEDQRSSACISKRLTQAFIEKHWKDLTEVQCDYVCKYQKLTQTFISKHWKELTNLQRNNVYHYQNLSSSFKEQLTSGNILKVQEFIPVKTMRYLDMDFEDF